MHENPILHRINRRTFLKVGGLGAVLLATGGAVPVVAGTRGRATSTGSVGLGAAKPPDRFIHLAGSDGYLLLPGRGSPSMLDVNGDPVGPPLYFFDFVRVPVEAQIADLDVYKGAEQFPAPIIGVDEEADVYLTMTNLGFAVRPDIPDSHTIHWHGFPNAAAIFDGVPEVSIDVPVGSTFPYFYLPHRVGTFIYHCHWEDVEHVQMGMQGIVYVRPGQNGTSFEYPAGGGKSYTKFAYNDGDGSTGYEREFTLLLDELWTLAHDNAETIQESGPWPFYDPNYWTINGRSWPDTILQNNDPSLPAQPISSLIQVNESERVLLRISNLGYQQQAMQVPGIRLLVVGEDAAFLRGPGGADLSYFTNTIDLGASEARDVIFTAPDFDDTPGHFETDANGRYNVYWFKNRDLDRLNNNGLPGLGGQVTQVWVYEGTSLAAQAHVNQTYPEAVPTPPYLDPWLDGTV